MASEESYVTDVCSLNMEDEWHHRNGVIGNAKNLSFHWNNQWAGEKWQNQVSRTLESN